MSIVNIDFNDVPDENLCVGPGVYFVRFEEAPEIELKGDGDMVKAVAVIEDEGDFKNRKVKDYHCLWMDMGKTGLKRMAVSAGVTFGSEGMDLNDFVGQVGRVSVGNEEYTPKGESESRTVAKIRDWLAPVVEDEIPADTE